MKILLSFVVFLLVTYLLVLQIFKFTTYHRYFFKALPFLLGYSMLVGYAMSSITPFHGYWFTLIWGSGLLFLFQWRSQKRKFRAFVDLAIADPQDRALAQLSGASTRAYYMISALTYLTTYTLSFLIFLNLTADGP